MVSMDISSSRALQLVMAALVGATVGAASAYYIHKQALVQQGENSEDNEAVAQRKRHNSRHRNFSSMPNFARDPAEGLEWYGFENGEDQTTNGEENASKRAERDDNFVSPERKVVSGLAIGVANMKADECALLHVGWHLGYGEEGNFSFANVPTKADLVYEVELIGFQLFRKQRRERHPVI